jgi:hypothetical membrane protein
MPGQVLRREVVILAAAGIVGPILFTVAFIVQGLFRPTYSHMAEPVSALAAGPNGWVQDVNFLVFGPLMIAYAVGLHMGLGPTRFGLFGPALLLLSGVGLILAGVFPARDDSGAFSVGPGHLVAAFMSFVGAGAGLIVISRRMAHDPRWRSVATSALASGIAIIVLFLGTGRLAVADDAPLHQWAGLLQRVTVAVWFTCTIVLALRLLRVQRATEGNDAGIAR